MTRIWNSEDLTHLNALEGLRIAILGYGSQGRAHALNLRDSGHTIALGLREGGTSYEQALKDGFAPTSFEEAARDADLIAMLLPDPIQPEIFERHIAPQLKPGALLLFAHGFNIHYNLIQPPKNIDIGLIAPKSPGNRVREEYLQGRGVPCLAAIHQDATDTAWPKILSYGRGLGGDRAGILRTTFAEETETDLFGEQAVICGGVAELVRAGFDTLTEAGYSPEAAYFECLHELKLIVDLLHHGGLARMHRFISDTASYGALTRGPRIIEESTRERMRQILSEIQSGAFAKEWIEAQNSKPNTLHNLKREHIEHPIESAGSPLRTRMPWLASDGETR